MERVNQILNHPLYKEYLKRIKEHEEKRIFCKHNMVHFLDVCRIAENEWLKCQLETAVTENYNRDDLQKDSMKTLIYATGILHDIGRWQEYEIGIRHEIASCQLAEPILENCGFDQEEKEEILKAILNHRNADVLEDNTLSGFIYRADKKSRACFACDAEAECDWPRVKKNLKLV